MSEDTNNQSLASAPSVPGELQETKKRRARFKTAKRDFIRWLATPGVLRSPATAREFALQRGVAESTLSVWKGSPEVESEVRRLVVKDSAMEIADILTALKNAAKGGSVEAIRLWLEFVHNWMKGSSANIAVQNTVVEVSFGDELRGFWNSSEYKKSVGSAAKADDQS